MKDQFTDRLSDYLDDELDARERADVAAHLTSCAECRRVLGELERVVTTAQRLDARPPATDLWSSVAQSIQPRERWWKRSAPIAFTLPQAIAATLVIALLSGGMVWWHTRSANLQVGPGSGLQVRNGPDVQGRSSTSATGAPIDGDLDRQVVAAPVSLADAPYDAAVADLEKALAAGRGKLDPATVAVIEQSLAAIDHAIEQARQALESDPANSYLNGHLVETRRRKLDLLRRAAALTTEMN